MIKINITVPSKNNIIMSRDKKQQETHNVFVP